MSDPKNPEPSQSRRNFLKTTGAASVLLMSNPLFQVPVRGSENTKAPIGEVPWYRRLTRWGQTNITEPDSQTYDIGWWRGYWKRTLTQGIVVNAGGIVAYYPSRVPFHRQAEHLAGRDLFGELCNAAHQEGLAVFARMDSNRAHEDLFRAHPDWFAFNAEGKPYMEGDLYVTCVNSPYYDEFIPSILKEVIKLYRPEGFTDNMWHGLNRYSICHCKRCSEKFKKRSGFNLPEAVNWDDPAYRQWIRWNYDRRLEIWDFYNNVTKTAGGDDCIWVGMTPGSISWSAASFRDYKGICERAGMIMLDHQARYGNETGFHQNGEVGKLIHGMLGWDKIIPESMAMYQQGTPNFRLTSKPEPEARMWVLSGFAGGIQPWWHHVAAYHEDRRMYRTVEPLYKWHSANEEFLINRRPVATVGVVWSQENMDFYGRNNSHRLVDEPWRGMTQALLRARIPYLPVHADHIDSQGDQFSVLVLPNLGVMTDEQISSIRHFASGGGGLVATGQSSLFNQWGEPRPDYGLSDLFGAHAGEKFRDHNHATGHYTGETLHTYLRITPELRSLVDGPRSGREPHVTASRHPVFKGFNETDILPFGGNLVPASVDAGAEALLTFVPDFPRFPPEMVWMREPVTNIPGLVLNTSPGGGRIAFLPADIDRQFARHNLPDHSNLLANLVRWACRDNIPLEIEGGGLIDCNLYHQPGRMILHLVNLNHEGAWRQPLHELSPVGPLTVRLTVPGDVSGESLRLLVSGQKIPAKKVNGRIIFEIKIIHDHEVIVVA